MEVLSEIHCLGAKDGANAKCFVLNFLEISDAQAQNYPEGCHEKADTN